MDLFKKIFKGDKVIWIIFLFFCLISIMEVFSAASTLTYSTGDHWGPITRHFILLMVGAVIVWCIHIIPYKWFQIFPVILYPISLGLLVLIMVLGMVSTEFRVNGASRWFSFYGVEFQPSELAKMACIILTAFILSKPQKEGENDSKPFWRILGLVGLVCLCIAPENLSTALLLAGVVFLMMFIGGISLKRLGALIGVAVLSLALFIGIMSIIPDETKKDIAFLHRLETWENRLTSFGEEEVPPEKFDINHDAQKAHSRIAIASSNIIGKLPGNSIQRDFLSQAFSDFIFAIIIEELGLIGGAFVVALYIILLVRVGKIAQKCDRTFPAYLVMGIGLLIVSQAILNMMVATGLFPITGQPLPLISKGGTSIFINCAYIGMILSVSRYTEQIEQNKENTAVELINETQEKEGPVHEAEEPTSKILNSDSEFK